MKNRQRPAPARSGPRTGLDEISLPATQPGSSIMPGKVNPVIPEAVNMVAAHIVGNDAAIAVAAMNGSLDLNVMMPVIAHHLLDSAEVLGNVATVFAGRCVAASPRTSRSAAPTPSAPRSLVTAVVPLIGYDAQRRSSRRRSPTARRSARSSWTRDCCPLSGWTRSSTCGRSRGAGGDSAPRRSWPQAARLEPHGCAAAASQRGRAADSPDQHRVAVAVEPEAVLDRFAVGGSTRSRPAKADTSISSDERGRWKLVTSAPTTSKRKPG